MMKNNSEIGPINKEQKKIIDELEEVLNFLKSAPIKDEHVLINIKKPLTDLRSSLKYIPTETSFEIIPTEIKRKIMSYLCDTNAFAAASVCAEWKEILKSRFTEKRVTIGKSCCSYPCTDNMCLMNSEMLKASTTHKLDVHLIISHSVREVDSKLVTDALTSVSSFSLIGNCTCYLDENECEVNPLSVDQLEDLFKGLEKKVETMEEVILQRLDLTELNQERLAYCFVNKIKKLMLHESDHGARMLDIETFVKKISQKSDEFKLNQLSLDIFEYPHELALELAKALCNVENVKLVVNNFLSLKPVVTQLIKNILTPVMIKNLIIDKYIDFRALINPADLKRLCNKMATLRLAGQFTLEQVEAARSLPDVTVTVPGRFPFANTTFIEKGSNIF